MFKTVETDEAARILSALPRRIDQVIDCHAVETPDRIALIDDGDSMTYGQLHKAVADIAFDLTKLGIRPGDRLMIVS